MDSNNERFHSETEFYYPEELDLENKQNESNSQAFLRKNELTSRTKLKSLSNSNDL